MTPRKATGSSRKATAKKAPVKRHRLPKMGVEASQIPPGAGTVLRDGTSTMDIRLDRLRLFDARSRDYPVTEVVDAKKRRGFTWRIEKVLDQGPDGACVGFSWGGELLARPAVEARVTDRYAKEQIYWEAQKIDPWEGGSYPGAAPQYEGSAVLAGAKVLQRGGWITEYRWAFGEDDLALAVGYKGPAVLGVDWTEGMFNTDDDGFIHPTGGVAGGHAILCIGYSLTKKAYRLQNSWGPRWGQGGQCWIAEADLASLLDQGGEACIPIGRRRQPKVPVESASPDQEE